MRKTFLLLAAVLMGMAACAKQEDEAFIPQDESQQESIDNKEEQDMNTETTFVTLTIGDVVIPATLNHTQTAREFIKRLPFTVTASRGEFDYCGTGPSLPAKDSERQTGWKPGDIGYSRGWFALFFDGEEESKDYPGEMIIGHIDGAYLETVRGLGSSVRIVVDLKKE